MFISTPCWVAFYSPGSHPAKGNHSNSSRAESGRGAKRGEIVTRKAGAGEERLKNKLEPKSSTPGINKSNPHPKIKPAKGKSQGTLQVGSKLALSALLQSALQQGIPQGLRLPTAAPRSHKVDGWAVQPDDLPANNTGTVCMFACRERRLHTFWSKLMLGVKVFKKINWKHLLLFSMKLLVQLCFYRIF